MLTLIATLVIGFVAVAATLAAVGIVVENLRR
jgi:hypothetical protein